jgi:putative Mg2+ transporter-C (MgtC) family protein
VFQAMSVVDAASLSDWEVIGRVVGAAALGAVIGTEREVDGQDAGVRTHALLALGAGMFGVMSVGAFSSFLSERAGTNVQVDVTRIASYVAAGVGFLGGGAILKTEHRVKGLTTAASLWSAAAVGLAAGLGFWVGAIAATITTVVMLLSDKPIKALRRRTMATSVHVVFVAGADPRPVLDPLVARGAKVALTMEGDSRVARVGGLPPEEADRLLVTLSADADVLEATLQ